MEPALWRMDRYLDFLEARRDLIARKLNEFMNSLISEPEETHHRPVTDLITLGESYTFEFKSTLQWDVVREELNKVLRLSVLKTIAAFLNSQGGTLVIGVEDDGSIIGLAPDFKLLSGSKDRFQKLLADLITEHIGAEVATNYRIRFERIDGSDICVVDVERASAPVFTAANNKTHFFVRVANTTRTLDTEEAIQYIESNWD